MKFKQWLEQVEQADRERQLDKGSQAQARPTITAGEISRYGYMKKLKKK